MSTPTEVVRARISPLRVLGSLRGAAALLTLALGILASPAHAQLQESSSSSSSGDTSSDGGGDRDDDPMAWLGLGVKTGVSYVGGTSLDLRYGSRRERVDADSRVAFQVGVPINIGGSGLGLVVEPYFAVDQHVKAYGGYAGPTLNLHIARPVYLGVGAGIKVAYLTASYLDHGVDIGGRIPFTLTVYPVDALAVLADVGIGYTASGYAYADRSGGVASDTAYGGAFTWDASLGLRFP